MLHSTISESLSTVDCAECIHVSVCTCIRAAIACMLEMGLLPLAFFFIMNACTIHSSWSTCAILISVCISSWFLLLSSSPSGQGQ